MKPGSIVYESGANLKHRVWQLDEKKIIIDLCSLTMVSKNTVIISNTE